MDMATSSKSYRIVISGYYGFNNSGDEAVLRSILLALEEQATKAGIKIVPIVLSGDPAWTSQMYGVEAVPRMQPRALLRAISSADALISGGGSLLQDATGLKSIPYYTGIIKLAQLLKKPTFIYAQGIGPVFRKMMYPFISSAMNKSEYISVRDEQSAQFLKEIGVTKRQIDVVPDPVMGMPLSNESIDAYFGRSELSTIGVSVRNWNKDRSDLKRIGEAFIQLLQRRNVRLMFLPFHTPDDVEASQYVMDIVKSELGENNMLQLSSLPDDPQIMLKAVSQCDVLFGMRLHALIYAANQSIPMLGLSYDPKIDQFLKRVGIEPIGTTNELNAEHFTNSVINLLDHNQEWIEKHRSNIQSLIEQSQVPAQQIVKSLRQNILR